jgi:hypothetical protein
MFWQHNKTWKLFDTKTPGGRLGKSKNFFGIFLEMGKTVFTGLRKDDWENKFILDIPRVSWAELYRSTPCPSLATLPSHPAPSPSPI